MRIILHFISWFFIVLIIAFTAGCRQNITPDMIRKNLNTGWEFKNLTDKNWLPATVPGTIHTDLLNNKIINEPFFRDEETKLQWIGNETWMYRLTFDVENEILQKKISS